MQFKPRKATFESAGFRPTVYGRQPLFFEKEAVVRNPAVYRCSSVLFSSYVFRKHEWGISYSISAK
jgi:hypothetical protein